MSTKSLSYTKNGIIEKTLGLTHDHQVLIKCVAFGINRLDIELLKSDAVEVPGLEVSGVVAEVGSKVQHFKKGDLVMALVSEGAYSEYVVADESTILLVPSSVDLVEAAALPEALFTGWLNIFEIANATEGESVLIQGASGAVGLHTALMTRAMGLKTFVSVGSREKKNSLEKYGFAGVISYSDPNWVEVLQEMQPTGINVIYDVLGPKAFNQYFKVLSKNGRLVMIDALLGDEHVVDVGAVFSKQISISGSLLRPQTLITKKKIADEIKTNLLSKLGKNGFNPVVGHVYQGLNQVPEAFRAYESRSQVGKILVKV